MTKNRIRESLSGEVDSHLCILTYCSGTAGVAHTALDRTGTGRSRLGLRLAPISARQRRTKSTGLGICCACGAELLALGHSGVASFCFPYFFFGMGSTDGAVCMFLTWRT